MNRISHLVALYELPSGRIELVQIGDTILDKLLGEGLDIREAARKWWIEKSNAQFGRHAAVKVIDARGPLTPARARYVFATWEGAPR
jgi:hypothetical protein